MRNKLIQSIATYIHPKIIAVLLLGFSSGLPRLLVASTLGAWLLDSGVEKAAIGLFAYVAIPYSFNFVWAPLVDHLRLPWLTERFGRRRGWMLLSQAVLAALLLYMGQLNPATSPYAVAVVALLIGFMSATQDIVIDAYRTEFLDEEQYGQGAAVAVFGYRLGMLVAGAGALYIAQYIDWSAVYPAMAAFMLVGMVTALVAGEPGCEGAEGRGQGAEEYEAKPACDRMPPLMRREACAASERKTNNEAAEGREQGDEANKTNKQTTQERFFTHAILDPFRDFAQRHKNWLAILLFILFYRVPDGFIGFMTTPFLLDIGFTKVTVANIGKLYGFAATIAGMFIGGALIGRLGVMCCLWWFLLFQIGANLMYAAQAWVGVDPVFLIFTISMDNLSGGMVTAAAIAYMMSLCSMSYTATQYALLSSLASLASITLAGSAGWIAEIYGWEMMFILSAVMGLPALVAYRYLGAFNRH